MVPTFLLLYTNKKGKTEIDADREDISRLQDLPCSNTFQ